MDEIKWRIEGIFKANAAKCLDEIGRDVEITPEQVLEKARDEQSELHKCFEWNDSIAAEKYRLQQARQLIQFLVVVPKQDSKPPIRHFQITSQRNVYMPTTHFATQHDEYQKLLQRAYAELRSFQNRYKSLSELERVFEEIDKISVKTVSMLKSSVLWMV